jgi:hypothetical protein
MSNELATVETDQHDTLRQQLMSVPVVQQKEILAEYQERRKSFREWILSNMREGLHYGYPPGCVPKLDDSGNMLVWNKDKNRNDVVPKEQWQAKPSLYEAGADLLIDLLMYRSEFLAATDIQQQIPELKDRFVIRCTLFDRSGKKVGEGIGAAVADNLGKRNGQGLNLALKLSKKRAKVDAVKNTLGISDLFTQDTEDLDDDPPVPPKQKPDAAKAQPRGQRVTSEEIKALSARWRTKFPKGERTNEQWAEAWFECVRKNGGPREDITNAGSWNRSHVDAMENYFKLEGI